MTPTPNQQAELDHLIRFAQMEGKGWRIYAEEKARDMAHRMPKRWGWLPAALALALSTSPGQ